ncbi:adenosine deaminase family protein [Streptomyces rimosus]|uniref:adenosine deaminase family protein n=1 Tax=Streptomyces rimosus TaxID=1927 RepID=UPI00099E4CB7|nr:adenosine deaminase [Streptomyces rimosus]
MITNTRPRRRHRRSAPLAAGTGLLAVLSLLPSPALAAPPGPGTATADTSAPERTAAASTGTERRVDAYLTAIRNRPAALRSFFRDLPKGGDLHNHLSGAASTELLIKLAGDDGLCIETKTMTARTGPCGPGTRPAAQARTDRAFHRQILRAWSMQDFSSASGESGHDHFFATFGKFGEVTWRHNGTLLADVANTAARQNQFYLETMLTPASSGAKKLADQVGYQADLSRMHHALVAGGKLDKLVREAGREVDKGNAEFRKAAGCGTHKPGPGCRMTIRYISQVSRGSTPARVFTQMALAMRLAERDHRYVAVNLVQPEDEANALRNYRLHMRMLDYLHRVYPRAHITLHAGELVPGLVKPEDLRFHINEAVRTGHAERIGHGVDVAHEDNAAGLLRTMAKRDIAVEVPFTSNRQILGVTGADHPFPLYRRFGVPVVLATDDPGVSRSDISTDYRYAATTYGLRYRELKDLARASLEHSFLPGRGLWADGGNGARHYELSNACRTERPGVRPPHTACKRFLAKNLKAALEWKQEEAFARFEHRILKARH